MQIPTLIQARRALLELMHAQRDTMPPQFAVISMYLDSQVPLNVENSLNNQPGVNDVVTGLHVGGAFLPNPVRIAQPAGGQADMSRSVSMGGGMGGGSSAGGMGGGSSAGGMGGGSSAGGMGGGSSAGTTGAIGFGAGGKSNA